MASFAVRLLLRPKSLRTITSEGEDVDCKSIAISYLLNFVNLGDAGGISFIEVLKDDSEHIHSLEADSLSGGWPTAIVYKFVVGVSGPVIALEIDQVTEEAARRTLYQAGLDN